MKIQLERNLNAPFHQFRCVACQKTFTGSRLRTFLCHDDGSIAGDVCVGCLKQGNSHIKQQLGNRSIELFKQPSTNDSLTTYREALELSELAAQALTIPPFYYQWWKQLTIFAAEAQELELARREMVNCRYRQPKPHKIAFLTEEPSIGRDN
jgi:hypothetical protein